MKRNWINEYKKLNKWNIKVWKLSEKNVVAPMGHRRIQTVSAGFEIYIWLAALGFSPKLQNKSKFMGVSGSLVAYSAALGSLVSGWLICKACVPDDFGWPACGGVVSQKCDSSCVFCTWIHYPDRNLSDGWITCIERKKTAGADDRLSAPLDAKKRRVSNNVYDRFEYMRRISFYFWRGMKRTN
jgi:hypothetical protein